MRRLLICTPSHAVHGGVEAIVNDLTRELPRRGWDVVLGLAAGQRFNDPQRYRAAYPDLNSIDIDGSGGTRQARVEALIRAVRTTRPDVVLAARIFDAYPSIALLKRQQGGPRLAVAIRACESDYLHDVRLHRAVIDLCVADGNLLAAACEEWCGMAAERVANIPGGVRMPQVIPEPRRRRTPIRLGYVGRLAQHDKRIFDLVPFLEELDRRQLAYQMDVVGTGPDAEAVAQALSEWLRRGIVRWHGWQDSAALYERFLPALDCVVHFSAAEGVTIAPREAMAHGVVPVISEFLGIYAQRHFVHEHNALIFPVGQVAVAARHVQRLVSEPGLLTRLSATAAGSQTGAYEHGGSIDAWASALDKAMGLAPACGTVPVLRHPDEGRLARLRLHPWLAQRLRDVLHVRPVYADPGSEWPTSSGTLTSEDRDEFQRFASEYEARCREATTTDS